jgi:hypothetical protein
VRTLRRAAEILGGHPQLRKYLNVSAICLAAWMTGVDPAPTDVFLRAVDLVVDADVLSELRRDSGFLR